METSYLSIVSIYEEQDPASIAKTVEKILAYKSGISGFNFKREIAGENRYEMETAKYRIGFADDLAVSASRELVLTTSFLCDLSVVDVIVDLLAIHQKSDIPVQITNGARFFDLRTDNPGALSEAREFITGCFKEFKTQYTSETIVCAPGETAGQLERLGLLETRNLTDEEWRRAWEGDD